MASNNMQDIKRRIKSVGSTRQITKAMELVASSKLRKAKARAEQARPYFNELYKTMCEIASANDDFSAMDALPVFLYPAMQLFMAVLTHNHQVLNLPHSPLLPAPWKA